ncbi:non-specific lipid transfer protein GPI-anchored 15-like [Mangifera indica]|uniref:non-specific lipid transfer protein GPI-anchored 15-like n=1 Tax=Mangifera indica TaxID=29780 RepID=UPI001CFABB8E|nr:non-specific lipid transfer protein GPI-anchored 15-like [Mangifera indica]
MKSNARVSIVALFLVVLVGSKAFVDGAGECGKTPIGSAASSLLPCLSAARNVKVKVPRLCCSKVNALIKSSPKCLCAVLLSPLAKLGGINPAIAVTIPKRCNIKNRQAGKKCGKYTIP